MKAQKAAAYLLAISLAQSICFGNTGRVCAAEEQPGMSVTVGTTAAETDGSFTVDVYLEGIPEPGVSALEFAIGYDTAALNITGAELLYDTGAQAAQQRAYPELAERVFMCDDNAAGMYGVRWVTVLENTDYWLKENRPFFRLSGVLKADMPAGTLAELRIVPPAGLDPQAGIPAGYADPDNTVHRYTVNVTEGGVWKPIDETGATKYGDINLDGQITVSDAVMLQRAMAEELALSAAAYANADCEFDGMLTMRDISLMLRYLTDETGDVVLGSH